jgi:acyl phosphate:glycerol-3-phosphate acyltransferase
LRPVAIIGIAYLLGSIPFGYLVVHAKQGGDVRQTGSGGTGATNVSRRAGKGAGVITLLLDASKGAAASMIAKLLLGLPVLIEGGHRGPPLQVIINGGQPLQHAYWWVAGAAVAVIVGHMFPVWLGFRGGKGVATGVGVFLVLAPLAVVGAGVIFVLIVWRTRYVSLGSIVAAAAIPLFVLLDNYFHPSLEFAPLITAATAGATLIIFAHRGNIGRLIEGSESKFR